MTSAQNPMQSSPASQADGALIGLLAASFYGLFTLLPGSSTLMAAWPWVVLWQAALALPVLWLLWQLGLKPLRQLRLASGLDWIVLLAVIGLGISTLFADFPHQALWAAWAALGGIAALYALNGWLTTPKRRLQVLQAQGGIAIAFIVISLGLWITQIYLPELARLSVLSQYGVQQAFSFNIPSLRNWQPIGHQNYVAGYLALVLPLLAGLGATAKGGWRWLWSLGGLLGLIDLYTTSSRGGWASLFGLVAIATAVALLRSPWPRRLVLPIGLVGLTSMVLIALANSRLRRLIGSILQGDFSGGELAYRLITNTVGWRMGTDQPLTGIGPGSVPIVYQKYLPVWGGREAELQYQLHSTPAQLWGELGIWGVFVPMLLTGWLVYQFWRWRQNPTASLLHPWLVWSLGGGLWAYSLISLTDYQLDIIGISGTLVVYLAVLAGVFRAPETQGKQNPDSKNCTDVDVKEHSERGEDSLDMFACSRFNRLLAGMGLGVLLAMTAWLAPTHRAWMLSAQGFDAYEQGNLDAFVQNLERAHQLAPWEPYYPYQLGWRLGDLSYSAADAAQAVALRDAGIEWFEKGIEASPYQEFGHSNLGWLLIRSDPEAAAAQFAQSAQLLPVKEGVFFGLGFSLLLQEKTDLAIEAMVLELLRHPMLMTSRLWRLNNFAPIYPEVLATLETRLNDLLESASDARLVRYLQQVRGGLRWWTGAFASAAQDWEGIPLKQALLRMAHGETIDAEALPESPGKYAILAWQNPPQRRQFLMQAWLTVPEELPQLDTALPPPEILDELERTMNLAESLDSWLKNESPATEPRNKRLGFNVISRHVDGQTPADYYPRVTNVAINKFFETTLPSLTFLMPLDNALQTERSALLGRML